MLRMSTPQGPGFHSSQHSYHSTIGREKAAPLNLGKERIGLAKTTDGIPPYPSPPMSDGSNHQDRGSPNHHEDERSSHRLSMPNLPRVQYSEGYRDSQQTSTSSSHQHSRSAILPPPLIHPTPVPAQSIATRNPSHILSSSAPVSGSPFSIQQTAPLQVAPKKPKSHVPSACVHCKKAHLGCGVERPCQRCISLGKQDSCVDVPHKKRGRPRLKESGTHSFEVGRATETFRPLTESMPSSRNAGGIYNVTSMTPMSTHSMESSYHSPQQPGPVSRQYARPNSQVNRLDSLVNPVTGLRQTRARTQSDPPRAMLLAVLTPDLVFLRCTETVLSIYDIDKARMGHMQLLDLAPSNRREIDGLRIWLENEIERRGQYQRLDVRDGMDVAERRNFDEWSDCIPTAMQYGFQLDLTEGRQVRRVNMVCALVPARTHQYVVVANFNAPSRPTSSQSSQYYPQYSPALPSPILSPPGRPLQQMHRHSVPTEFPSTSPGISSPGISSYSLRTLPSPLPARMAPNHPSTPSTPGFDMLDPTRPRTSPGFKLEQPPVSRAAQQAMSNSHVVQLPPINSFGSWDAFKGKQDPEVASTRSETSEDETPRKRNRIAVSEVMNP